MLTMCQSLIGWGWGDIDVPANIQLNPTFHCWYNADSSTSVSYGKKLVLLLSNTN